MGKWLAVLHPTYLTVIVESTIAQVGKSIGKATKAESKEFSKRDIHKGTNCGGNAAEVALATIETISQRTQCEFIGKYWLC